jgi:hypothetical protein
MRFRVSLAVVLSIILLAGRLALAQGVCDVIRSLHPFRMIATQFLRTKVAGAPGPGPYYCRGSMIFEGSVCANTARLMGTTVIGPDATDSYLVSLQTSGSAVVFRHPRLQEPCYENAVNHVVTGGGEVVSRGTVSPDVHTVDTSGGHPLLASCAGAMADMVAVSDAIAAMPARQTIDRLVIGRNEEVVLDARGGGVIRIGSLRMRGIRGQVREGYNNQCWYAYGYQSGYDSAPQLWIDADYDDEVILDVGDLSLGDCAILELHGTKFLINVAGTGPKVRIGVDVPASYYSLNVLAPQRMVKVEGEKYLEFGTQIGALWADRIVVRGYTDYFDFPDCTEPG